MSVSMAVAANRVHIPAIGRIPGRGTATLISPGVLLTSTKVVGNKDEAANLKVIFYEATKQEVVEARLLPSEYYFAAVYPEHLDYCLVACETKAIFNVSCVKLPLVKSEWKQVREGDHCLIVQHPTPIVVPSTDSDDGLETWASTIRNSIPEGELPIEQKPMLDVIRRRDDLYFFKVAPGYSCAGCPCFNDNADLVGIHSQFLESEEEGMLSRMVSIQTVVKHLFANGQLGRIKQTPLFADVWDSYYVQGETVRIVCILANFKHKDIARPAVEQLCEHTSKQDLIESVVACGGTKVIIDNIHRFREDEELVSMGLRALWNISFGQEDNRQAIVDAKGLEIIHSAVKTYITSEPICQFGTVCLFNITLTAELIGDWCFETSRVVLAAMQQFHSVDVIQKFGIGFFVNIAKKDVAFTQHLVTMGAVEHTASVLQRCDKNEYLTENAVGLIAALATHAQVQGHPSFHPCVGLIAAIIMRFPTNPSISLHGNRALWSLGNNPVNRIELLTHPDGPDALAHSIRYVLSHGGL